MRSWLTAVTPQTYLVVPALPKGASVELQLTAAKATPSFATGTSRDRNSFAYFRVAEERVLAEGASALMSVSRVPGRQLVRVALPYLTHTVSAVECANFATYRSVATDTLLSVRMLHPATKVPTSEWVAKLAETIGAPVALVGVGAVYAEEQQVDAVLELATTCTVAARDPDL